MSAEKRKKPKLITLAKLRRELEKHRKRNIEEGHGADASRLHRILDLLDRCD